MVEANQAAAAHVPVIGDNVPPGFNMEEEQAMKEFIDDVAFDALVDGFGEAFVSDLSTNAGSSALLDTIMEE